MKKGLLGELERELAGAKPREASPAVPVGKNQLTIRGKKVVDYTSWDFLGAAKERSVVKAAQAAIEEFGLGSASARLSSGTRSAHTECEIRLAKFFARESALLFSSKSQALISLITSILHEKDALLVDDRFLGPAADAAYLVNADVVHFQSDQLQAADRIFSNSRHYRRRICVVESLSPLNGKAADLKAISALCTKHGIDLIVDESFALGIMGLRGAGGVELAGIGPEVMAILADLSWGAGVSGAVLAGPSEISRCLLARGRSFSAEAAPLPAAAKAAEAAIDFIELQTFKRDALSLLSRRVRDGIKNMGVPVGELPTPVICLPFKSTKLAEEAREALFSRGYLADALSAGIMFSEAAVIRIIINAAHEENQIDGLLNALSDIAPRIKG